MPATPDPESVARVDDLIAALQAAATADGDADRRARAAHALVLLSLGARPGEASALSPTWGDVRRGS